MVLNHLDKSPFQADLKLHKTMHEARISQHRQTWGDCVVSSDPVFSVLTALLSVTWRSCLTTRVFSTQWSHWCWESKPWVFLTYQREADSIVSHLFSLRFSQTSNFICYVISCLPRLRFSCSSSTLLILMRIKILWAVSLLLKEDGLEQS